MAFKLGVVVIDHVADVNRDYSTPATSNALEDNTEMSDHVSKEPKTISLSGFIIDPDNSKQRQVEEYQSKGTIIDYNFMTELKSVVIENFSITYDKNIKDGYNYSLSLKQVITVKRTKINITSGMVNRMTRSKTNMGLHVVEETKKVKK